MSRGESSTAAASTRRYRAATGLALFALAASLGPAPRLSASGKIVFERSAVDSFHSDLVLVWGCNPVYTQIPNAHFFTEARYHGTRFVAISPDYNASAIHADEWIPVRIGSDAALALAMVQVSREDARARGIENGAIVEVRNDVDAIRIHAKLAPSIRPGQCVIDHAWENFQFAGGKGFQNLMPTPLNPVELAGGQFHLRPNFICIQPGLSDRDTRVEVRKVG